MTGDFVKGLGSRSDAIRALPDADARGLTPEERGLIGAVGTGATIGEVLRRCGLPEPRALALLLGLRLRGIVMPVPAAARPATPPGEPGPRRSPGASLDAAALREAVDLDEGRKREVLELEARVDSDDHFAILGLPPGASPADVKKAYYELTRRFHPDRYFGKNLGSFRARIDRVFRRLTEAQSVLSDPNRRREYLEENPHLAASFELPPMPEDPERAAERRARLARHPYLAKHAKIHELMARGRQLLEKGEFSRAASDFTLALQIDPRNREADELLKSAKRGGDKGKAEAEFKDAVACENMGDAAGALARFRRASQLDPDRAECAWRLARLLMQSAGDAELREAHQHARRACELAPENADYRLTFAKVLVRSGLEKNAVRELEAVLKARPNDSYAKEQLRKLKWKI